MNRKLTLWFMIALFATTFAKAGGYQINIQGIKQNGMGYIGTGFTLDASSVFFNPGGMSLSRQNIVLSPEYQVFLLTLLSKK